MPHVGSSGVKVDLADLVEGTVSLTVHCELRRFQLPESLYVDYVRSKLDQNIERTQAPLGIGI